MVLQPGFTLDAFPNYQYDLFNSKLPVKSGRTPSSNILEEKRSVLDKRTKRLDLSMKSVTD
jgi:hypothetical protein